MELVKIILPILAMLVSSTVEATVIASNSACDLPFTYGEHTFAACTTYANEGKFWCSTTDHYEGHWVLCKSINVGLPYWNGILSRYQGAVTAFGFGGAGTWVSTTTGTYRLDADHDQIIHDGGALTQISVGGSQVWGVNVHDQIWMLGKGENNEYTTWMRMPGALKDVTVSPANHVWGVNSGDAIFHWTMEGEHMEWVHIGGSLKQISAGKAGVWGVNRNDDLYYRMGTFGDNGSSGFRWQMIGGIKMTWVAVGTNFIVGITPAGAVKAYGPIGLSEEGGTVHGTWTTLYGVNLVGGQIDAYNTQMVGMDSGYLFNVNAALNRHHGGEE